MAWPWSKKTEQRSISSPDIWGPAFDTGSSVTVSKALTLAPVFAATSLISTAIAAMPLQAYRQHGDERQKIATPALFETPSFHGGTYEWIQRCLTSLLLRGNAYGLITEYTALGYPRAIEWLHPDDVSLSDDRTAGRPTWYYLGRPIEPWVGRDSGGQLLHIPNYVLPGQVLGLSPIGALASTIDTGIQAQKFGRDWFKNGAVPASVLESEGTVSKDDAKLLKGLLKAATKNREPLILGSGQKYRPIAVAPEESQFIQTQQMNATQIAVVYGVPPERVGGGAPGGSIRYTNVESNSLALVTDTFQPYLTKLEQAFSSLLPRPQYVRFALDSRLRGDSSTRARVYAAALDPAKGWMSRDEVRALEDLPPEQEENQAAHPAEEEEPPSVN